VSVIAVTGFQLAGPASRGAEVAGDAVDGLRHARRIRWPDQEQDAVDAGRRVRVDVVP
jgi:hypothetical protein